jgi:hypothetical protein
MATCLGRPRRSQRRERFTRAVCHSPTRASFRTSQSAPSNFRGGARASTDGGVAALRDYRELDVPLSINHLPEGRTYRFLFGGSRFFDMLRNIDTYQLPPNVQTLKRVPMCRLLQSFPSQHPFCRLGPLLTQSADRSRKHPICRLGAPSLQTETFTTLEPTYTPARKRKQQARSMSKGAHRK